MINIEHDWVSSAFRVARALISAMSLVFNQFILYLCSIWFVQYDHLSQGRVWGAFTVLDRIGPTCLRGDYWRWSSWRPTIGGRGGEGGETVPCAVDLSLLDLELHTHDCVWDLSQRRICSISVDNAGTGGGGGGGGICLENSSFFKNNLAQHKYYTVTPLKRIE